MRLRRKGNPVWQRNRKRRKKCNFTQDYNETITRLDELIKYTQNPNDLQRYLALADEVDEVFVAPLGSGASKTQSVMSGSEQIAQLNRVMMLNMGMK